MPFKAYYLTPTGELRSEIDEDQVKSAFESGEGLLWVDISDTTDEDGKFLERIFNFHPLAIEDCLSTKIHSPKVDDFGDHIFIIVHGVNYAAESEVVETAELAIFLGRHFVMPNGRFCTAA